MNTHTDPAQPPSELAPGALPADRTARAMRRRARQAVILVALLIVAALLDDGLIGLGVTFPLVFAIPILAAALVAGGRFILPVVALSAVAHAVLIQRWAPALPNLVAAHLINLAFFAVSFVVARALSTVLMSVAFLQRSREWRAHLGPMPIGSRFVILPGDAAADLEPGLLPLRLDPGAAFGSGSHPTTRMCVALLEETVRPGDRVFDLGCGSGILAIAALKLGATSALGADIDPEAERMTRENADKNGVVDQLSFRLGSVETADGAHFELVTANILADVLVALLGNGLAGTVAPGGALILSGIRAEREAAIAKALAIAGFGVVERRSSDGWVALLARAKLAADLQNRRLAARPISQSNMDRQDGQD
ncbi:MAG TPA: 50S ribosomal protein L11 methyltransferase [Thermoflexales bacterium]|nr:50S ribosomal protein L11 methyltransferase [Thermoflexales bacterium]HQY25136.1 50S ribosomal protein L11 methyltransferase [Thermoflexales bacterium]HQZ52854.1 50S ribosomal protein L11 methyltransferase [Thermoflexales bacterium]HRA54760.1 50S ribosomal protein L11 methyltransferase [Thermoflexales bacterium]